MNDLDRLEDELDCLNCILTSTRLRLDKLEKIHPKNKHVKTKQHVKEESPCTHGVASGRPGWSYKECGDKFCKDCGEEL